MDRFRMWVEFIENGSALKNREFIYEAVRPVFDITNKKIEQMYSNEHKEKPYAFIVVEMSTGHAYYPIYKIDLKTGKRFGWGLKEF